MIQVDFKSVGPGPCGWCLKDRDEVFSISFSDKSFIGPLCKKQFPYRADWRMLPRRLCATMAALTGDRLGPSRFERKPMSYCLGIKTRRGLVFASDSRTNAGMDQVNTCRKLHTFVQPGQRVFVVLTSGSLSVSQSIS